METNQLLINYYKKEELKKIKERQQQGLTTEEIINLANKEYISIEEIKNVLGIDDETEEIIQEHIVDEEDIVIEDEPKKQQEDTKIVILKINELEDYPNQPFRLYNEEKEKRNDRKYKINGIMQPLIVRPLKIINIKY